MKTVINLKKSLLLLLLILSISLVQAQEKTSTSQLINNKNFVFKVQTILPPGGSARQTAGEYDVRLLGDSLISYLPYFGRAYSAPLPGQSGGFNFTSTKFDYTAKQRKKGGWEISIQPKDVEDVREFFLTISEKGYGTLRVLSNNRQPISYNGYVTAVEQRKS